MSKVSIIGAGFVGSYIVGEHGDSEVPLWSLTNIAGIGLEDYCNLNNIPPLNREKIFNQVKNAGYNIIAKKGATYYAVSMAVKRICEALLRDEHSVLTVSGLINGNYGITDTCLSSRYFLGLDSIISLLGYKWLNEKAAHLRQPLACERYSKKIF